MGRNCAIRNIILLSFFVTVLSKCGVSADWTDLVPGKNTPLSDIEAKIKIIKPNLNEDIYLNVTELLTKYGYHPEVHIIETSDGYLLKMIRIRCGGDPVLVFHGSHTSSDDFVTPGPQSGLAYQLCDAGFDVWLGNARGTKHSKAHINLSVSSPEFWDFSHHEIGYYDNAAMIDYVLKNTNVKQVKVIAYSHGTTTSFILASERPEYNEKISIIVALSPIAWIHHSLAARTVSKSMLSFMLSLRASGLESIFADIEVQHMLSILLCGTPDLASLVCYPFLSSHLGGDRSQINKTSLPVIFSHMPAGISTKQYIHKIQMLLVDKFRQYDYGSDSINHLMYGSKNPPEYSVEKIVTKVALFTATNDWYFDKKGLKKLTDKLKNVIETYRVPYWKFSQVDFVYAKNVKTLLYNRVIHVLKAN